MSGVRFGSTWASTYWVAGALLLACVAFWLYRRQLRQASLKMSRIVLPLLRASAIFLIVLTLAEPTLDFSYRDGQPGRLYILLDDSESMSYAYGDPVESPSRYERAVNGLLGQAEQVGLIEQLSNQFEIHIFWTHDGRLTKLWDSGIESESPLPLTAGAWMPPTWSRSTSLGKSLSQVSDIIRSQLSQDSSPASIVLLTDGLSNAGPSPRTIVSELAVNQIPIFAVGFSPSEEPPDIALLNIVIPPRANRTDLLRGTLVVSENQLINGDYVVKIESEDQVVAEYTMRSTGAARREIPFTIAVDKIFDRVSSRQPQGIEYATLPIKLEASIIVEGGESNQANNSATAYCSIVSQKSKMLLIDGRSRWETRYLKNVFSRDPAWELTQALVAADVEPSRSPEILPKSRDELLEYDLIVVGEIDGEVIDKNLLVWMREFVESAGGGIIFIDGARQKLRHETLAELHRMLPVQWNRDQRTEGRAVRDALHKRAFITPAGLDIDALQLVPSNTTDGVAELANQANSLQWAALPALQFVSQVTPLTGSEVLLEANNEVERLPLLISRRYGAGRVLFMSTDETWRWRYRVADELHARFWNQLARWTMKQPMSVENETVSLDTGSASYLEGETISVRCQLRDSDRHAARGRSVSLLITNQNGSTSTFALTEESIPGCYTADIDTLAIGEYRARIIAAGYDSKMLELESEFSVLAPPSSEMQQLACDEQLLHEIASKTGGVFLPEDRMEELTELLQPRTSGTIRHETWLVWQSFGWFAVAMLLLAIEWGLRRRVGLS